MVHGKWGRQGAGYRPAWLVAGALWVFAAAGCGSDHKLSAIDDDKQVPTLAIDSLHLLYTESGLLRVDFTAPVMERYLLSDEPFDEFKKGINIFFYTPTKELESEIKSDYAIHKEKPVEMWQAINRVVITNYLKKQTLYTDTLYWNRAQKTIYTDAPVHIVTPDGEIFGYNGMTSDERFNDYEIRSVKNSYIYASDRAVSPDSTATPAAVTEESPLP